MSEYRTCDFWSLEQYIDCSCNDGSLKEYDAGFGRDGEGVVNLKCDNCGQKVNLHYSIKVEVKA